MKKVAALVAVAFVFTAVLALAADDKMGDKKMNSANEGTITKLDMAGKMMMVKDSAGKETSVYWDAATKVQGGELKEGSMVHYWGTEKDGKMMATKVHVGEMKMKGKM